MFVYEIDIFPYGTFFFYRLYKPDESYLSCNQIKLGLICKVRAVKYIYIIKRVFFKEVSQKMFIIIVK